jgi:hypothetical protein
MNDGAYFPGAYESSGGAVYESPPLKSLVNSDV